MQQTNTREARERETASHGLETMYQRHNNIESENNHGRTRRALGVSKSVLVSFRQ